MLWSVRIHYEGGKRKTDMRHRDGLVLCDNCDNPASAKLTKALRWRCCAACVYGEADALREQLEDGDTIPYRGLVSAERTEQEDQP